MIKQDFFFGFIAIFFLLRLEHWFLNLVTYEIIHDDACRFEVMVFDIVDPGNLIGKNNLPVILNHSKI